MKEKVVLQQLPGYKSILKSILQVQIKLLVDQLEEKTGDECIILVASIPDRTLCQMGTKHGEEYLRRKTELKSDFLSHCLEKFKERNPIDRQSEDKSKKRKQAFDVDAICIPELDELYLNKMSRDHDHCYPDKNKKRKIEKTQIYRSCRKSKPNAAPVNRNLENGLDAEYIGGHPENDPQILQSEKSVSDQTAIESNTHVVAGDVNQEIFKNTGKSKENVPDTLKELNTHFGRKYLDNIKNMTENYIRDSCMKEIKSGGLKKLNIHFSSGFRDTIKNLTEKYLGEWYMNRIQKQPKLCDSSGQKQARSSGQNRITTAGNHDNQHDSSTMQKDVTHSYANDVKTEVVDCEIKHEILSVSDIEEIVESTKASVGNIDEMSGLTKAREADSDEQLDTAVYIDNAEEGYIIVEAQDYDIEDEVDVGNFEKVEPNMDDHMFEDDDEENEETNEPDADLEDHSSKEEKEDGPTHNSKQKERKFTSGKALEDDLRTSFVLEIMRHGGDVRTGYVPRGVYTQVQKSFGIASTSTITRIWERYVRDGTITPRKGS